MSSLSIRGGGKNTYHTDSDTNHFYWLDLLRFIAAFAVMACHYRGFFFEDFTHLPESQQTEGTFAFFSITRLGHEAVLIFFVLSGFLVGGRLIERLRKNTFNIKSYAIDRSVRIFLPLISALILIFIVNVLRGNPDNVTLTDYLGNLFSLQGIYVKNASEPLWSLSYEVWFYILAGGTAVMLASKNRRNAAIAMITVFISMLVFTRLNPTYLLIWSLGAIIYSQVSFGKSRLILYGSFTLMIISIVALQATSGSQLPTSIEKYLPTTNRSALQIWFAMFCCVFIRQIVLFQPKYTFSLAIERAGTKLAAFSYTLYLTHIPIMRLLEYFNLPSRASSINATSVAIYIFAMLISLIGAYMIYWCFEKRTPQVKVFIKRRLGATCSKRF